MPELDDLLDTRIYPFPQTINLISRRSAILECPVCLALDNFYSMEERSVFETIACKGNLPPECEHQDFLGRKHTHLVQCAGVTKRHFHVKCHCCESVFLLHVPERN